MHDLDCGLVPMRLPIRRYTREYYQSVYGVTMGEIPISFDSTVVRPQVEIPPHYAGHPGTEEDSLGSFLYLMPKVPKKNFTRMMDYGQKMFRFMARLETDRVEDIDRVFVVKYFLAGARRRMRSSALVAVWLVVVFARANRAAIESLRTPSGCSCTVGLPLFA